MSKYSESLVDDLIGYIAHGDTDKMACEKVGIVQSTLFRWLQDDEKAHLQTAYARAKATRKTELLLDIANTDDWRAKAWYVEKVYGHERPPPLVNIHNTIGVAATKVRREVLAYPDDYDAAKYGIQR